VVIKIHCASRNLESRPIKATGILDLVHVSGDIATGSAERGVALKQGVRINLRRSNSLGSLVSETYLVAQVDTALVRAAHNGAVFKFATDAAPGAVELLQVTHPVLTRLLSEDVSAPLTVDLFARESICVTNSTRVKVTYIFIHRAFLNGVCTVQVCTVHVGEGLGF